MSPPEEIERPNDAHSDERRRLLRGGLAVGPVILTIMSRPVLGQTPNASIQCSVTTCQSQSPQRQSIQYNNDRWSGNTNQNSQTQSNSSTSNGWNWKPKHP